MSYRRHGSLGATASVSASADVGSAALDSSVKEAKKRKGISEDDIEAYGKAAGAAAAAAACAATGIGAVAVMACGAIGGFIGGVVAGAITDAWNSLFGSEPVSSLIKSPAPPTKSKTACDQYSISVGMQFMVAMAAITDAYYALWPSELDAAAAATDVRWEMDNPTGVIQPFQYIFSANTQHSVYVALGEATLTKVMNLRMKLATWNMLAGMLYDAIQDGTYVLTKTIIAADQYDTISKPALLLDVVSAQGLLGQGFCTEKNPELDLAILTAMANAIEPGTAKVVAALMAKQIADETERTVRDTLKKATDTKSAYELAIKYQQKQLEKVDRDIASANSELTHVPTQSYWPWIAGGGIVVAALLWSRR